MDQHQQPHPQYKKFYVEWWRVSRRSVYGVTSAVLLIVGIIFGSWWAISNNVFVPADTSVAPKDAARIISFEGDVRITRAATRDTIVVKQETFVAEGDTIQTQSDGRCIVQM